MSPPDLASTFHQHRYVRELDRLVPIGGAWLDVGAGHRIHDGWQGPSTAELAGRVRFLAGCDLVEDVLSHPHLHDARIADATALPWEDETFDLVTANMVVEHLSAPMDAFREIARVLKPDGVFLFVTPNRDHPVIRVAAGLVPRRVRRLYAMMVEGRAARDVFVTEYRCNTVSDVRRLAAVSGLVPVRVEVFLSEYPLLPGPLGWAERRIGRFLVRRGLEARIGSNILGIMRKPAG